jgi:hypothetical protein
MSNNDWTQNLTQSIETGRNKINDFIDDVKNFGKNNRTKELVDEKTANKGANAQDNMGGVVPDWRVKIKIPKSSWGDLAYSDILSPLMETDGALVFPYTPNIQLSHTAAYTPTKPVHSNYAFHSYQNSAVENLSITGEFTVETEDEGKYWIAAHHFLKSVTKMVYGENENLPTGAPPPVLKLHGYGAHIFNNTPIVIKSFNLDLENGVDYMLIRKFGGDTNGTYVPVRSAISVQADIVHSREKIRNFSLEKFIRGEYVQSGEFR